MRAFRLFSVVGLTPQHARLPVLSVCALCSKFQPLSNRRTTFMICDLLLRGLFSMMGCGWQQSILFFLFIGIGCRLAIKFGWKCPKSKRLIFVKAWRNESFWQRFSTIFQWKFLPKQGSSLSMLFYGLPKIFHHLMSRQELERNGKCYQWKYVDGRNILIGFGNGMEFAFCSSFPAVHNSHQFCRECILNPEENGGRETLPKSKPNE